MPRLSLDTAVMDQLNKDLQEVKDLAAKALREAEKMETIASDTNTSYVDLMNNMTKAVQKKNASEAEVKGER